MFNISDQACQAIRTRLEAADKSHYALRVQIMGRGPQGFEYGLFFVKPEDREPQEQIFESNGVPIFIHPDDQPYLQGATLDLVDTASGPGFRVENPNPLWHEPLAMEVQRLLDGQINPGVATHGGRVALIGVRDNNVYIRMGGGCQGCGMANVTLKQGVEKMLRQAIPEIEAVIDVTEHEKGANPYYEKTVEGASPIAS